MGLLLTLFFFLLCVVCMGQVAVRPPADTTAAPKRPVQVDLLSNYYTQDGDRSAVNGGRGPQKLDYFSQGVLMRIPSKDSSRFMVNAGVDHYTSASLLQIDKYPTAASTGTSQVSGDETRTHVELGYEVGRVGRNVSHGVVGGYSTEYDVNAVKLGYTFSRQVSKDLRWTTGLNATRDRWLLIYPREFRQPVLTGTDHTTGASPNYAATPDGTEVGAWSAGRSGGGSGSGSGGSSGSGSSGGSGGGSGEGTGSGGTGGTGGNTSGGTGSYGHTDPTTGLVVLPGSEEVDRSQFRKAYRQTVNWRSTMDITLDERTTMGAILDVTRQWGLLSTPFHRVYFNDGVADEQYKEVRVERLPSQRLRVALGVEVRRYLNYRFIVRGGVRGYVDDWGMSVYAAHVDLPIRLTPALRLVPGYRFSWQSGTRYFVGYSVAMPNSLEYYTSDRDLAWATMHKPSLELRWSPLQRVLNVRSNDRTRTVFSIDAIGLRWSAYDRSDGLTATSITLGIETRF